MLILKTQKSRDIFNFIWKMYLIYHWTCFEQERNISFRGSIPITRNPLFKPAFNASPENINKVNYSICQKCITSPFDVDTITKEIYIFITMINSFHYAYSLPLCKSIEWMNKLMIVSIPFHNAWQGDFPVHL